MKVTLSLKDIKALSAHAKKVGTEKEWMELALKWMEAADKKIDEMSANKALDRETLASKQGDTPDDGMVKQ